MTGGVPPRVLLAVGALAATGFAGTVAAIGGRGADDAFLLDQANPQKVTRPAVEKLVRTVPDPAPPHTLRPVRVRCRAGGPRGLRNPWRCALAYRSGTATSVTVVIRPDGSYRARYAQGPGSATGCCLAVPGSD
jgi:hypothetical protein